MSLAGFRCPPHVPTAGHVQSIEHCLNECPHQCVAPPLLAAMWKENQTNVHQGNYISASMLAGSGCPRQTVFERKHDFYELPQKRYWPFRGTHAHSIVERAADIIEVFGWMQEMRMTVDLLYDLPAPIFRKGKFTGKYNKTKQLTITVSGTTDCYNPLRREMWDMKSMADAKAQMMIRGTKPGSFSANLDDGWVRQLNIYRYLVSRTPIPPDVRARLQLQGEYFPAPELLGIQGIGMMDIPRTGMTYALREEVFEIDSVPVWDLDEVERFIYVEALQWFKWLVLEEPTPVVPKSKKWLCDGCAFNRERYPEGLCSPTLERGVS